jgi:hypothetical protein
MAVVNKNHFMKTKNTWMIVSGVIAILCALIIVDSFGYGFRKNAQKWAKSSLDNSNIISASSLTGLDNPMIIDLDGTAAGMTDHTVSIPVKEIVKKENYKKLKSVKGSKILVSKDPELAAKIWMILSQMGIRDLYILEKN